MQGETKAPAPHGKPTVEEHRDGTRLPGVGGSKETLLTSAWCTGAAWMPLQPNPSLRAAQPQTAVQPLAPRPVLGELPWSTSAFPKHRRRRLLTCFIGGNAVQFGATGKKRPEERNKSDLKRS